MAVVLVLAAGAPWEPQALELLAAERGTVVLKRCVDVDDLLATATAGQADVALVAADAPGLDVAAVDHLRRCGVGCVPVAPPGPAGDAARARAARAGLTDGPASDRLAAGLLPALTAAVAGVDDDAAPRGRHAAPSAGADSTGISADSAWTSADPGEGLVVAVWGPHGAPGRTTVATTLATHLARHGQESAAPGAEGAVLVDADPWGGAVAQHLGVLDEVSGLLAAARLAAGGDLVAGAPALRREVRAGLSVVTGLPRPDRWSEVRPGTLEQLLEGLRPCGPVVVDAGPAPLDDPPDLPGRPARGATTTEVLELADEVVVVGSADPVGLARLARALVELRERRGPQPVHVAVNRVRPSLGWGPSELAGMVEGFARVASFHALPEDQAALDAALVAGRSPAEDADGAFARAVAGLLPALLPGAAVAAPVAGRRGLRLRRRAS